MKKILFSFSIVCLFSFAQLETLVAQNNPIYQLPNGDFEAPFYLETSNAGSTVPQGFNSFYSSTGSLASSGAAQRTWSSTDVRPGSTGTQSVNLRSNVVLIVRANGNLTTGRINAGSMIGSNEENYNYTDTVVNSPVGSGMQPYSPPNPPKFCQQITGTPDSLRFWTKYLPGRGASSNPPTSPTIANTTDQARIRVLIHGIGEARDAPAYPSGKTEQDYYYGKAVKNFYKEDGGWHCYQVPFVYDGKNTQKNSLGNYYVLVSLTTNATPTGGANNPDWVWFDDIEFIYSAWLTDLKVNGVTVDGFSKGVLTYGGPTLSGAPPYAFPYQPSDFSYTPEVSDVKSVVITNVNGPGGDANGGYTSILVTAEDGVTQKEYRMYYFVYLSDNNNLLAMSYTLDDTTPIPIPGFNPAQTVYNITLQDPEEVRIPQIVENSIVLSDPATAEIQRIEQPTGVNSKGMVVVRAENLKLKSYNVIFEKVKSTNSKLNWIKIGGTDIAGFNPDVLEYDYSITTCTSTIPAVTHEKASVYASVNYVPATYNGNRTATLTVTAENGTQRVYKVNFIFTNNDVSFTRFRFSGGNSYDITPVAGQTVYERAFSFTAAQTITPTWGCTSVIVNRVPAATVYYPDTNYFHVKALNLTDSITYKIVLKNTNCFLATGNNAALRYNYNGLTNQNTGINITTTHNGNLNPVITTVVTTPIGPNVPAELVVYGLAAAAGAAPPTYVVTQPTHRKDTATVTLTANDGVTQKIYRVPFSFTPSPDATLKNITYNGFNLPGFLPANENYTLIFPSSVTDVPIITVTPNFQWLPAENIVINNAATLAEATTIEVTAESGAKKTYTIHFEVVPQEKDAYLVDIKYDNNTIAGFNPTIYNYNETVPYSAPTPPKVVPVASSPTALIFPSIQSTEPPYTQYFMVYSEDMSVTKIYKVDFTRVKNTNASLANILINGEYLQGFHPELFEYEVELPYTELSIPVITAIPSYQYAQIAMVQPSSVYETVIINVTAEDDAYSAVYTVDISRVLSPVADIATIVYDYNNETSEVNCTGTEMTIALPVETLGEPLITEIVLVDNRSEYVIDEQPDATNNYTGTIVVTAEDETEKTYSIAFERTLSGSTLLTEMGYTLGTTYFPLDFHPDITTYTVILPYNNSQTPVISATANWIHTGLTFTQPSTPFGQGSVLVVSENGQNNKTYTVVFQRKGDAHLVSLSYNLDGESIPIPNFSPTTFNYIISLDIATTSIPVLEYVLEDNRCNVESIQQDAPNGTSYLKIVTWNQDDSLTYSVNFTVQLSTEALLDSLFINGESIANFNPNVFHYDVLPYDYGTEPIPYPVISGETKYADATMDTTQINGYPGVASIKVTAGNPSFTNTYTVSFSVEAGDNNYLKELTINGSLYGLFDKYVYFYKHPSLYGSTNVPVVGGTPEDPRATIEEIEQAKQFGDTAKIYVKAINGDIAVYQVLFIVDKNNNAYAKMIYIDWKPMEDFNGFIYDYTYILPANYTGEPFVTAETEDPNAKWDPNVVTYIPLVKQIVVTAENGVEQNFYTITFEKANSIIHFDTETTIQVYPNPASEVIYFNVNELKQVGNLEIYSLEGKKTGNHTLQEGINTVNIEQLPKGIYFYKIFSDGTMIGAGKFVKN